MADKLMLREPFLSLWWGQDPFEEVESISGRVFRAVETRRTLRFEMDGKVFFLKLHHGVAMKEILKSFVHLRMPVWGAENEWLAIQVLQRQGVETLECLAYGAQSGVQSL